MLILAASLFFTNPAPFDMPRQEAYLVRENGLYRLEDRCKRIDLWFTQTMIGRWFDRDGRIFELAEFHSAAPSIETESTLTRRDYEDECRAFDKKDMKCLRDAVSLVSPAETPLKPSRSRRDIRGYREVLYWQGTNESALVATYLKEKSKVWNLAIWHLSDGDDIKEMTKLFEDKFLSEEANDFHKSCTPFKRGLSDERELLRRDAAHSVSAYINWNVVNSKEFSILHALGEKSRFITALTNELSAMRALYSETIPSPIDGTNVLAVARIFSSRDDYIDVAGTNMAWTSAYWSPERREIVAYLPQDGEEKLLQTFRHEAFHQFLSYASSMISSSPWFNEGYAQYFEDAGIDWEIGEKVTCEWIEKISEILPLIFYMDYEAFYAGDIKEKRLKYRLAWSIAYFIEKGAPLVRFKPFKDLKRDYMKALLEKRNMHEATKAAFKNDDFIALFVDEWRKFWCENLAQ
jgi:hypothetical protein